MARQSLDWEKMFRTLKAYYSEHGDCQVPAVWKKNKQLGRWVVMQRYRYKIGTLPETHISRLMQIGFVWDPAGKGWDGLYQQLIKFKNKHGDCNVPSTYHADQALAAWVANQRHRKRLGELSDARIEKLNEIGFAWSLYIKRQARELTKIKRGRSQLMLIPERTDSKNVDTGLLAASHSARLNNSLPMADQIKLCNKFQVALLTKFPRGISFSPASETLLANAVGTALSEYTKKTLKDRMMQREDGTWLLPEMVANSAVHEKLVSRSKAILLHEGCFSMDILCDEFLLALNNLPSKGADFVRLFMSFVAPLLDCRVDIEDQKGVRLCYIRDQTQQQVYDHLSAKLLKVLQKAGDAVSVQSLCDQFPTLGFAAIKVIIERNITSAVELKIDGTIYWKLLEFFYLPDDMSEQLIGIINQLEAGNTSPSIMLIKEGLNQVYGGTFSDNFSIPDEDVMRQIVSKSYHGKDARGWKHRVFRRESDVDRNNVLDDFLQTQSGMFHESEFFAYAKRTRNMTSTGMLILTFLRNSCVRLNREQWISVNLFSSCASFSTKDKTKVAERLNATLGSHAFHPIGTLPLSFFENLPQFTLNGKPCPWNAYLLASVCNQFIPSLRIVNDEPSPYTVTAFLIPANAVISGDVVDYVLDAYLASGLSSRSALEIFEYLRQHQVRLTRSEKLMARIRAKFGVA